MFQFGWTTTPCLLSKKVSTLNFGRFVDRRCSWCRTGEGLLEDSHLEKSLQRPLRGWWHKTFAVSFGSHFEMFFYWNYLKSEAFEFAGLLATMHYSNGCWNGMHLKHTNYFGRRAPRGELCAQLSSWEKVLMNLCMRIVHVGSQVVDYRGSMKVWKNRLSNFPTQTITCRVT